MYFGSFYGIFLYLSGVAIVTIYSIFLAKRIMNHEKDRFHSILHSNDYSNEYNNLYMNNLNFMPFFEVR